MQREPIKVKAVLKKKRSVSLYVGQKVTLKNGKKGEVLEVDGAEFCIEYPGGATEWIAVSNVV